MIYDFDLIIAPNKDILLWYFWEGFYPSIRVEIDNHERNLDICNKTLIKPLMSKPKLANCHRLVLKRLMFNTQEQSDLLKSKEVGR